MKKLSRFLAALFFGVASFALPILKSSPAFAEAGDPVSSTITIASGQQYLEGNIEFDEHQLPSTGGTVNYDSTLGNHVIKFGFGIEYSTLFGYTLDAVTVNGTDTPFTSLGEDRYSITVSEQATYALGFTLSGGAETYTIIWANPGATDIDDEDALIQHGYAKIIAVYDADGNLVDPSNYVLEGADRYGLKNGSGWAAIRPGSRVVFEFVPEYGYQLTSVSANGQPLEPQATPNQYVFIMPQTHIHFAAVFTKTADVINVNSDAVAGGTVSLSSSALGGGTARISVTDVQPEAGKIAGFDEAAKGYAISNFLDIDFFNIFYKGKADSTDVWSNQLHELGGYVTITLKLADDVDVSKVVLVHNIGDGDEYEIIEIESYDTEAHTITFKTKSFSGFAIATKVGAPDSGALSAASVSFATSTFSMTVFVVTILSAGAWFAFRH